MLPVLAGCGAEDAGAPTRHVEVSIQEVARLGGDYPAGIGSAIARVSRLRDGRFLASSQIDRGEVVSFDAEGVFLRRFGGYGDGPGEFRAPAFHWLTPSGDTLVILDPEAMRITGLSSDAEEVYQTSPLPIRTVYGVAPLHDGTTLINGPLFTSDGAGLPFHVISERGEVVRSFGSETPLTQVQDAGNPLLRHSAVAVTDPHMIWVAHRRHYRLELWDLEGRMIESFEPDVGWFNAEAANRSTPRSPAGDDPRVALQGLWQDANGLLWVIFRVPDPEWRQQFEPVEQPVGGQATYRRIGFDEEMWNTRINVWDPSDWTLVADTVADSMWFGALGDGFAYSRHLDEQGVPYMKVWSATLSPVPDGRP